MNKVTEADSHYDSLEQMSTVDLLHNINNEDEKVARIVKQQIPSIVSLIEVIVEKLQLGGRLFYLGAGTSGRLGILDASECPPTFGVSHDLVIGLIAGGDSAIRKAVEFAEDNNELGWEDLKKYDVSNNDVVVGIAASGTTPYVVGALKRCQEHNVTTGCITCNLNSPLSTHSDYPIEVIVGPEFVTGSTRMKAGTAQKLVLNIISTTLMIKMGKIKDNKMIDMQLSNNKLIKRAENILIKELEISHEQAKKLLDSTKSVRKSLEKK